MDDTVAALVVAIPFFVGYLAAFLPDLRTRSRFRRERDAAIRQEHALDRRVHDLMDEIAVGNARLEAAERERDEAAARAQNAWDQVWRLTPQRLALQERIATLTADLAQARAAAVPSSLFLTRLRAERDEMRAERDALRAKLARPKLRGGRRGQKPGHTAVRGSGVVVGDVK